MRKVLLGFVAILAVSSYALAVQPKGKGLPGRMETSVELMDGEVEATASFENPQTIGGKEELEFNVKLEYHTVDLSAYNFEKEVVLRDDKGKTYNPVKVDVDGRAHHRDAELRFKNPGKVKSLELLLKNLAGVKEVVFEFPVEEMVKVE